LTPTPEHLAQIREFVQRMGRARNKPTQVYMPAALLAVCDLAAQGKVRNGIVRVSDYKLAFKRLMLEVWPEREDFWWRPMLHVSQHRMWTPMQAGEDVELAPRRISRLQNERQASALVDAFRLDPIVLAAVLDSRRRDEVHRSVYSLLAQDGEEHSRRLASVHEHLDASAESPHLRNLLEYEHRLEDRDAFEDLRQRELGSRVLRPGQGVFRKQLLEAYDGRCCMSRADVARALDAAHILPLRGPHTHGVNPGLLLRRDLHTLFDDGLITVDATAGFAVALHEALAETVYSDFAGRTLALPQNESDHPNRDALDWHHRKNRR
jgi:predicted restriction endonuclease